MNKYVFVFLLCGLSRLAVAQEAPEDTTAHQLSVGLYVDAYYAAYSGSPAAPYAEYVTVGARDNSLGLNVAQFSLHYTQARLRGNFTFHSGDIAGASWSADFPYVQEANVGLRLGGDWWLDAGFFRTHIGTESFLPKNNLLSSTAYVTYNEPFYQAGARLSYAPAGTKWHVEAWLLNGYNSFVDNNGAKSVGMLISYAPTEATSLTYTNLLGNEAEPQANTNLFRVYQNAYWNQQWGDHFSSILGFDLGIQSNSRLAGAEQSALLYAGLLTLRYQFDPSWSVTTRGEVFHDENGFISGVLPVRGGGLAGADLTALTLGTEYRPSPNAYLRAEARYARTPEDVQLFADDRTFTDRRWELLFTFGFDLNHGFAL